MRLMRSFIVCGLATSILSGCILLTEVDWEKIPDENAAGVATSGQGGGSSANSGAGGVTSGAGGSANGGRAQGGAGSAGETGAGRGGTENGGGSAGANLGGAGGGGTSAVGGASAGGAQGGGGAQGAAGAQGGIGGGASGNGGSAGGKAGASGSGGNGGKAGASGNGGGGSGAGGQGGHAGTSGSAGSAGAGGNAGSIGVGEAIIVFDGGTKDAGVALGGRSGVDAKCVTSKGDKGIVGGVSHALISVSDADEIGDMPALYGVPANLPIVGPTGVKIADDWADLLDGNVDASLVTAGVIAAQDLYWLTGSTASGAVDARTCDGFTSGIHDDSNGTTLRARYGHTTAEDSRWLSAEGTGASCAAPGYHLVCIAYAP